jgi:L-aspartate oxidase
MFHANDDQKPVIIVGAGIAGLYAAINLAPCPVVVLSSIDGGGSSFYAQGGIAAACGVGDSSALHALDTIRVGGRLTDKQVVYSVTAEANKCIADLRRLGVPFDCDNAGNLHLSLEGGHCRERIAHVSGDGTGVAIMDVLAKIVADDPRIQLMPQVEVVDLLKEENAVIGVVAKISKEEEEKELVIFTGRAVIMAGGGVCGLYRATTAPLYICGKTLGLVARAGAEIVDTEFVQFHPTALHVTHDPLPLITEALRGAGAVLVDKAGTRIMKGVHPDMELAPRDIISRAIYQRMMQDQDVFLDIRSVTGSVSERFPALTSVCKEFGIESMQSLPVVPAAHYHMGGVRVDNDGRSSLKNLWVCGEMASTGMHGSNRLASNSLLEAIVYATRVAKNILKGGYRWRYTKKTGIYDNVCVGSHTLEFDHMHTRLDSFRFNKHGHGETMTDSVNELRAIMSHYVGMERNDNGLRTAIRYISCLEKKVGSEDLSFINMTTAAMVIAVAALLRRESCGCHYRTDYPCDDDRYARRAVITMRDVQAVRSVCEK